jgi:hypothetical protein
MLGVPRAMVKDCWSLSMKHEYLPEDLQVHACSFISP